MRDRKTFMAVVAALQLARGGRVLFLLPTRVGGRGLDGRRPLAHRRGLERSTRRFVPPGPSTVCLGGAPAGGGSDSGSVLDVRLRVVAFPQGGKGCGHGQMISVRAP